MQIADSFSADLYIHMDSEQELVIQEVEAGKNHQQIITKFFVLSNYQDKVNLHTNISSIMELYTQNLIKSEQNAVI